MEVPRENLRSMKENAVIAALPPMTKYSSVSISLFVLCGRKLSLAEEGRKEGGF